MKAVISGQALSFSTPKRKLKSPNKKYILGDFNCCVLQRTALNFYITEKIDPIEKAIYKKFCKDAEYTGCKDMSLKVLQALGWK